MQTITEIKKMIGYESLVLLVNADCIERKYSDELPYFGKHRHLFDIKVNK